MRQSSLSLKKRFRLSKQTRPPLTPSLFFNPSKQIAHCFGCGYHADSIKLVSDYKGLSFKDALKYLGIFTGRPTPEAIKKIQQEKYKRELIKGFNQWCYEKHDSLCTLYRELQEVKSMVRTEEDLESLARFYHLEPLWLHHIEILQSDDEKAKFELYREIKGNGKV